MGIPATIKSAISTSVGCMVAPLGISKERIDAALAALFDELDGTGARSLTNPQPLDRLLTRRQVAELLQCSTVTVTRMVAAGKLRAVHGGKDGARATRISETSLRAFTEGRAA